MRLSLGRLSIAQKLPAVIVVSALVVSAAVGFAGYQIGASAVQDLTQDRLEAVATERAQKVQLFLDGLTSNVSELAASTLAKDTETHFETNWGQLDDPSTMLRKAYIDANPNPAGQRWKYPMSTDPTIKSYNFNHSAQHPALLAEMQTRGYLDLFVFDLAGDLLYSVDKNDDF